LITFRLKDQFDRLHTYGRYRRAALLVIWGDRQGSEHLPAWHRVLTDSLADRLAGYHLRLLPVAHTQGAPFFIKGKIKQNFRDRMTAPVLLDWDGEFRSAYNPVQDRCNLFLFDETGDWVRMWTVSAPDSGSLPDILQDARDVTRP
jgi:hypothetical protein